MCPMKNMATELRPKIKAMFFPPYLSKQIHFCKFVMEFLEFSEGFYIALCRCLGEGGVEVPGVKKYGGSSIFQKFALKINGKTLTLIKKLLLLIFHSQREFCYTF